MNLPETTALLRACQQALSRNIFAVLVTVVATRGSVPRQAGAAMLVTETTVAGTIGGGHIELVAIERARSTAHVPFDIEYPLGATLGQCCGGAMTLRYEVLIPQHTDNFKNQNQQHKTLFLFGAGHVAQALVPLLSALPLRIVWADSRDAINTYQAPFPVDLPPHITAVVSDSVESELGAARSEDLALIMTHSHTLDESLVLAALRQPQLVYIGLIGSATKKRLFEQRLSQRGVDQATLSRLICPIGVPVAHNQHSKLPIVIALQVAAQITACL